MNCPLPYSERQCDKTTLAELIPKCRAIGCGFVDSDHDTGYLPGGCILLVLALVEVKKEREVKA